MVRVRAGTPTPEETPILARSLLPAGVDTTVGGIGAAASQQHIAGPLAPAGARGPCVNLVHLE
jgi:hypothetical protein